MSRIGKLPIKTPDGVDVEINGQTVKVSGPKGTLERVFPKDITVKIDSGIVTVGTRKESDTLKALHGTNRALLQNMVTGVSQGWSKTVELVGTGYRAEVSGDILTITVGYSHPVKVKAPEGVSFKVEKTDITIDGVDKEVVGQVSATIRAIRPPEPYKGKGIKYKDEYIRRKAGKAAKTAGAA